MPIAKKDVFRHLRVLATAVIALMGVACGDGSLKASGMLTGVSESRIAVYEISEIDGRPRASQVGLKLNPMTEICVDGVGHKKWSDLKPYNNVRVRYDSNYTALSIEQNC